MGRTAAKARAYDVDAEWSPEELQLLAELEARTAELPADAPRGLLSVRLSVFTEETTSPVRQELDLRLLALEHGIRVVGVASDLHVSATKVPPWRRKNLGNWLNNRAPEFDVILFWKMDRFIRRMSDLSTIIEWCLKYGKNLLSKNDEIDLNSVVGKMLATLLGGIAEIEASNTSTRVASLWEYAKTQEEWKVGKPAYGYKVVTNEAGKKILAKDDIPVKVLRWCKKRASKLSGNQMIAIIQRAGVPDSGGLTTTTLFRRLRNPALMGYRVEVDTTRPGRRSKAVLDKQGKPIRVAEGIFTPAEFDELQRDLDKKSLNFPATITHRGTSKFIDVLQCADCKTNVLLQTFSNNYGDYSYLRCGGCKSGGQGINNPNPVYAKIVADMLQTLGGEPVRVREYAKGTAALQEKLRLEESISHYMKELEPGGRYSRTRFTKERAEETLDKLIKDLEKIDPETTKDRWIYVADGKTFRQHWEEGGMDAMAEDMRRIGIKCLLYRTRVTGERQPSVRLKLLIPQDARKLLVITPDDFAKKL